ncbi:asparagine synthase (glutamine-hydrolyzing) [uncultured Propionibacterium sp.]|uniref:asparagine synthase (glutamine-hydrolyzing) n=1 Tax=uncultured Propionibacterium sp. TaxID=218066 RepID=UPI00292D38AA|nr:asparagine synthase (glutamine-hydrolyzing) [uncultured Propionibacterium sp.]
MCGFTTFISTGTLRDERVDQVRAGMAQQRHRGPDDTEVWHDDRAVMGFNRLSIIDIENSGQPLRWGTPEEPDRYWMVFNGEIYNYLELRAELAEQDGAVFSTEGDGEAIVVGYHYHGPAWVSRLRGMFAFVIWDAREERAFGARDYFGIKPLYTATTPDGFAFSSEAKSLRGLAGAAEVNARALQHYLVLQYAPEPESLDARLTKIESGCSFTVEDGRVEQTRYFHPVFDSRPVTGAEAQEELYDRIARVLDDSVAKHMRADVTVGSFLSGGIDSTAIAALAKRYNPDLLTFTAAFRAEGYSENDVADESARAIGVEHITRWVTEEELTRTLPLIIWYLDDPVADPALVPLYFVANEARKHVKVVLSGEGADEFFGGYTIYHEPVSLAGFEKMPAALRRGLGAVSRALPDGMRGKDMLRRGALRLEDRYYGNARIFREEQLPGLLRTYDPSISFHDVTDPAYAASRGWDPVQRMQHVDLFSWLRGDILVKADRMTMANSLELRVPFLDKEVFEVARHIPMSEKLAVGTTKYAMRRALERIVPAHVLHRRKLGFPVPTRVYLEGDSYAWARDIIMSSPTDEFIDPRAAMRLLDDHRAGVSDHSRRVWTIVCFMLWYDIFVAGTIAPEVPRPEYPVRL